MKYTAIAEVSRALAELIRGSVVPELVAKPDLIGLCSPANNGDFQLGIYLYNISESESYRLSGRQNAGLYQQKYPPIVLDLEYMITPYYKSDVKFLAEEEQVLLGRIVQLINDNSEILSDKGESVMLSLENPSLDDRQKIWNGSVPYRTSIFLRAKAVIVESARERKISRVTEVTIQTDIK